MTEKLTQDIDANDFGRKPKGVDGNSPVWVFGHLALYPDFILSALGRDDLVSGDETYKTLFSHGVECQDDPEGTVYPSKEAVLAKFTERTKTMIQVISEAPDEDFDKPCTMEGLKDIVPTVGALTVFMVSNHVWLHFGQVSMWRRVMGLGPCM